MPSSRFTQTIAFFELEPFGPTRDNLHFAEQTSIIFNKAVERADRLPASHFMWKDKVVTRNNKATRFLNALDNLSTNVE